MKQSPSVGIRQDPERTEPRKGSGDTATEEKGKRPIFCHGRATICLGVSLFVCVVLVAVVPPVCVLHGCPKQGEEGQADESINRLIVNFATIGKRVKSLVPPDLYDKFEEVYLTTSNIQVVTFPDATVLELVRTFIESEPDLVSLLQDQKLWTPPIINPLLLSSGGGNTSQRLLQEAATGVNYEGNLWQAPIVNYSGAWAVTDGNPSVVVAVLDSGCDLSHPDLMDNIWINRVEINGTDGEDDDKNGCTDDARGYDFAGECEKCPPLPTPQDKDGHGTHVAGIVAALRNGYGTVGVAPKVKVMCLKVAATNTRTFLLSAVMKAFDYALRMGAHVVSCSFGTNINKAPNADALKDMWTAANLYRTALAPLVEKNMLIVAAAGNDNYVLDQLDWVNSTYNPCFMARTFPDNMLCVLATDQQDKEWHGNVGNTPVGTNNSTKYVDIGAPGLYIMSTLPTVPNRYRDVNYGVDTGTSMATPMVAGVGALILSVLGSEKGNFYQGAAARRILLKSATVVPNIATRYSSRLNAAAALREARASLTGIKVLVPQPGFVESDQSIMMTGFNETYYAGDIGLDDQDFSRLSVSDTSIRTGNSRFEGYKLGAGYTLVARASVNLTKRGIYSINISTSAKVSDVVVKLGQSVIPLNASLPLSVEPGWYEFQLCYRNPAAAVDVRIAEPGTGLAPSDYKYLMTSFYTATPVPPRTLYYAPSIALAAAFQVLTRPNASAIRRGSVLDAPYPAGLQLDQPFNYSSVLENINFGKGGSALRDALFPASSGISPVPGSVVGVAHTRIRPPEVPMRFWVTCQLCSLSVNSLLVLDVYNPSPAAAAAAAGTAALTRVSGCLAFGRGFATHDLTLRFALPDTSSAALGLKWLPCDAPITEAFNVATHVTTHVVSPVLWRPSSGVAGYVSGMQCDVWPDPSTGSRNYPYESQPLLKFRHPMALSQSARGLARNLFPKDYGYFMNTSCQRTVANEGFSDSNKCSAAASFYLQDVYQSLSIPLEKTVLESVYMRCYTYVNRGFRTGAMQVRSQSGSDAIYVFLGSQRVFQLDRVTSQRGPFNLASLAANQTSLQGYYQLLAIEWRGMNAWTQVGLLDGLDILSPLEQFTLDPRGTLLPIPIVTERQAVRVSSAVSSSPTPSPSPSGSPPPGGKRLRPPPPPKAPRGRGLLQATVSSTGFANWAGALGSSAWGLHQKGGPGLSAVFFAPNASAPSEAIPGMKGTVVNSLAGSLVQDVVAVAAGLTGRVKGPDSSAGATRYMRADGFLLRPNASGSSGDGSAPMSVYVLRVRDGDGQAVSVHMGNVTVRNAVEFPAKTVTETRVEVMLPTGHVPTLVTVKSSRADAWVELDVGLIDPASDTESAINQLLWFTNTDSTVGK